MLLLLVTSCVWVAAGEAVSSGPFANAQVSSQAAGHLTQTFGSLRAGAQGPTWIGYAVPAVEGNHTGCDDCCGGGVARCGNRCRLEEGHGSSFRGEDAAGATPPAPLEGSSDVQVLWRVERGEVTKIGQRAVGAIAKAIEDDPETEVKKKAVFALSQLPKDQGVPLLIQQARGGHDREVRKQALFWLGQSGDPRALALFEEILRP